MSLVLSTAEEKLLVDLLGLANPNGGPLRDLLLKLQTSLRAQHVSLLTGVATTKRWDDRDARELEAFFRSPEHDQIMFAGVECPSCESTMNAPVELHLNCLVCGYGPSVVQMNPTHPYPDRGPPEEEIIKARARAAIKLDEE